MFQYAGFLQSVLGPAEALVIVRWLLSAGHVLQELALVVLLWLSTVASWKAEELPSLLSAEAAICGGLLTCLAGKTESGGAQGLSSRGGECQAGQAADGLRMPVRRRNSNSLCLQQLCEARPGSKHKAPWRTHCMSGLASQRL